MAGYRETSNYDPLPTTRYGRPLRPYNWVQWTGVAMVIAGIAIDLAYFAGRLGWIRPMGTPTYALIPLFLGISLINTRREEMPDPAPELAAQRRRWMIIVTLACVAIIGAAVLMDFLRS